MAPDHQSEVQGDHIARLRENRTYPLRARDLKHDFALIEKTLQRDQRRLGAVARAWTANCPHKLLPRTSVIAMNRGVLTIGADDSSTRFELDRWLRAGGEEQIIKGTRTTLRKIKVVVQSR